MNKILRIGGLLLICFILESKVIAQECELISTVLSYKAESFTDFKVCNVYKPYYIDEKKSLAVKDKLNAFFSNTATDTLISLIKEAASCELPKCNYDNLIFISERKIDKALKRNSERKDNITIEQLPQNTYFYLSKPIYYKDYVIIQSSRIVTFNNASTKILLYKIKGDEWEYVATLYSVTA